MGMRLEIDIPEHHYNNIMAFDSVNLGRVPYKGIIMYAINAIKHGKILEQEPTTKNDLEVDCIDRKATLDAIIKRLGIKNEAYLLEAERVIYQQILAMPSVTPQEPRWIPISEKAPEESGMYLVSGRWKNEPYEVWICEFKYLGELRGWANDAKRPIVTAWMPLPAPYEPQKSEEV